MQVEQLNTGFGRRLQAAREAAGLTRLQVANKLRLKPELVQALEQEDISVLPAPAFVRGYIRAYAQLVDANADELIDLYSLLAVKDPELTHFTPVESYSPGTKTNKVWGLITAIVIISVPLGVWFFYSEKFVFQDQAATIAQQEPLPSAAQAPGYEYGNFVAQAVDSSEPSLEAEAFLSTTADTALLTADDMSLQPASDAAPVPDIAAAQMESDNQDQSTAESEINGSDEFNLSAMPDRQDVLSEAPYGSDVFQITFLGACWVELVDANGYRLLFGLFDEVDDTLSLQGQAPFQLILGNAQLVTVSVNEKPFRLKPYIRSNSTARVVINANAELYR